MKVFISCLIYVVFCTGGVFTACPAGATAADGNCFIASKATARYSHARMYCLGYGCKLAVPSASLKTGIQTFGTANGLSNVIFGVLDSLEEGVFVEAPLGTVFSDTDWDTDKPSTSTNNNCVRINSLSDWKMSDVSCGGKYNFICDCGAET